MLTPRLLKAFRLCLLVLAASLPVRAQPVDVVPPRTAEAVQSLNGTWSFNYIPALDAGPDENFKSPAFDCSAWKTITVPGHWELQGFAEPQYEDDLKEGTGLYRRVFTVDKSWRGQRVFLRFDGVLYGFTAYVNGKPVGDWASSFNPATFDITDALSTDGTDNVLAVRVTTRSKGWNFDTMDCWALSGIYRDVTLFAVPPLHLKDYTASTTLKPDGSAELHVDVVASAAAEVAAQLVTADGKPAGEFTLALSADDRGSATLVVSHPQLWTAETPSLYRLQLSLRTGGKTVQTVTERIGLRQVRVENGILKLNGTPIKLHGVDHHDIWPEGRVATEANMRRDLELIRAANINFIRTSHYPPHPRFIELCDELGIYVDCEVPFIHGREHLKDPSYQDVLLTRARATVMRDKNHPSVIVWSLGNENPVNKLGLNTGKFVKELDPTRPIMFPMKGSEFASSYERLPDFVDIYAPHYPPLKRARDYAETLQRPVIFTEYAHQRGLARAGTAVQDLWETFYQSPRIAGGAIWLFQDQGLLRTTDDPKSVKDGDLMAWVDEHHYYDTRGFFAMDGIVYSDRTPQVDYWQVRKVYSSVQIKERSLAVKPGAQTLLVHVENRYDFRSLAGMKLTWSLHQNGSSLARGVVPLGAQPKQTETVSVPANLPAEPGADVFTLELRCEDESGLQFYERTLRLDTGTPKDSRWSALKASLPAANPTLEVSETVIVVRRPDYQLTLDRRSGRLSLLNPDGPEIVSAFGPHTGRHPTINDMGKTRERLPELWSGSLLTDITGLKTDARRTPEGVELTVSGSYPRPGKPEESISGAYKLLVTATGPIEVCYDYSPVNATGEILEAGFALALPAAHSEFRWLGEGPYAGYPGKDRLNEYGLFHLNRDDLYFPGNRRGVELAAFTQPSGPGVLLGGNDLTLDLEKLDDTTILSHVALVPGQKGGNENRGENVDISSRLKAPSIKTISGRFTLLPLSPDWPKPLTAWFGSPSDRVPVLKPFLRSYDQ